MPSIFSAICAASSADLGDFDSAAFSAAARVNLGFDHNAAAKFLSRGFSFADRVRNFAARHGNIILRQDRLRLILVNFHDSAFESGWETTGELTGC